MPTVCGRCRLMPVADGESWCLDCTDNDDPGEYVSGVPRWDAGLDADGNP